MSHHQEHSLEQDLALAKEWSKPEFLPPGHKPGRHNGWRHTCYRLAKYIEDHIQTTKNQEPAPQTMTAQELLTSLQSGLEYAQECLAVHDRDRGRTTPRNKRHAEEMATDIAGLSGCIHHIKMHFGSNVSYRCLNPKELDANARKRHLDACSRTPATQVIDDLRYEVLTLSNRLKRSEEQAQRLTQEIQELNKNYDDLNAVLNKTRGDLTIYKHQLTVARKDAEEWKNKCLTSEESLGQDITNLSQKLDVATKERDEAREALKEAHDSIHEIVARQSNTTEYIPKSHVSALLLSMHDQLKAWGMSV
jgi:chromosome segregation ATPase